ncbi:MAG: hypothetical protein OZ921_21475, partial [Sorangiineae bacterium]|nr:hypothetical protein [Sorangiineae bacterium]
GGFGPPPGGGQFGAPPGAMVPAGGAPMGFPGGGGAHGPIGTTRNPIVTFLISYVCFIYAIIQLIGMISELKAFRQKDDIPIIALFIPIWNLITLWGIPAKVLEAKQMAGVPNATVGHPILYLFLGLWFLPNDLNEVWAAASGGRPPGA